jgi:dienelactone hydrolase
MDNAGVDWQMNIYSGAVHAFTNPASGSDPSKGVAYNANADKRSFAAMKLFFQEIFK